MIIVALGSNLPYEARSPVDLIRGAARELERRFGFARLSPLYRSHAWPDASDPFYVNAAAEIRTNEDPDAILEKLLGIEAAFGRVRSNRWGPRSLDLDLIDCDGVIRRADGTSLLELPHPRVHERRFVLRPLLDLAPDWRHPLSGKAASDLLAAASPVTEAWLMEQGLASASVNH